MKQILLPIFALFVLLVGSCKKDDDLKPVATYDQLTITPDPEAQDIPTGQLMIFQTGIEGDTSTQIDFNWTIVGEKGTKEFKTSGTTSVINWTPTVPGKYKLTVKMHSNKYEDYQRGASFNVLRADLGFALWGYSGADIAINETVANSDILTAEPDQYSYLRKNGDFVQYTLDNDALVGGAVIYNVDYPDNEEQKFITDFMNRKDSMKNIYGTPFEDTAIWTNNSYKAYPAKWGLALAMNHVSFITTWKTGRTNLTLQMLNSDGDVVIASLFQKSDDIHRKYRADNHINNPLNIKSLIARYNSIKKRN